jgi:hypothetical protein
MKPFESIRLSGINVIIYLILIFISFAAIAQIWTFTDKILINPNEFDDLKIERPVIRPVKDAVLTLNPEILKNNEVIYQKVQRNDLIRRTLYSLIFLALFGILVLQLRKLIYSISQKPFFIKDNLKVVRYISYLLFAWVIIDFLLYQSVQFFIPLSLVQDNYNYVPLNKWFFLSFLFSINYSLLLAAFSFYVVSVAFKEGIGLKEQSDLTI